MKFHTIQYQKSGIPNDQLNNNNQESETDATQHPIFIFPGISGNKIETLKLGEILSELNEGKRLINIYLEARPVEDRHPPTSPLTLDQRAKLVADHLATAPTERFHFLLVGYSYGCIMAVLVAQYLKAAGHIPHLFLIDSPAPQVMKNYFLSAKDTQSVTMDLITVMNYVAKLSMLEELHFEKKLIEKIAVADFLKRIDIISKFILDNQSKRHRNNSATFKDYQENIKQKLQNILDFKQEVPVPLDKINLLMTDKTANKYHTRDGGWNAYTTEVHQIPSQKEGLASQEHTQLLVDESSCTAIAKIIHEVFIEDVLLKELHNFLKDYHISHKDTQIDYVGILNKLKKQISVMGQRIALQTPMNVEELEEDNTHEIQQKVLNGINTTQTKTSTARQTFGLFQNSDGMQIDGANDHAYDSGQKEDVKQQLPERLKTSF